MDITNEDIVRVLGNYSVMEIIALTRELENRWGIKALPPPSKVVETVKPETTAVQTEFNVSLASVPSDKKMPVIKAVRELFMIGLKEAKELVESAPKLIKEGVSADEAEAIRAKLTESGAVIEVK